MKRKKLFRDAPNDNIVKTSDPLFKKAFSVLSSNEGRGLTDWIARKQSEDSRMNGVSSRPRTLPGPRGCETGRDRGGRRARRRL